MSASKPAPSPWQARQTVPTLVLVALAGVLIGGLASGFWPHVWWVRLLGLLIGLSLVVPALVELGRRQTRNPRS